MDEQTVRVLESISNRLGLMEKKLFGAADAGQVTTSQNMAATSAQSAAAAEAGRTQALAGQAADAVAQSAPQTHDEHPFAGLMFSEIMEKSKQTPEGYALHCDYRTRFPEQFNQKKSAFMNGLEKRTAPGVPINIPWRS